MEQLGQYVQEGQRSDLRPGPERRSTETVTSNEIQK